MSWVRSLACLYILFTYQGVGGNKIVSSESYFSGPSIDNCICNLHGKIYNLGPLKRDDGNPRFTAPGSGQWMYSFNPCRSFSLGPPKQSNCFENVAICMWTTNKARYINIGKQTTAECYFNRQTLTPQLVYANTGSYKNWKAIVDFKCDPSKKTPEEAEFDYISDDNDVWRFLVTSLCACPGGCPSDPEDHDTATPPPPCDDVNTLKYIIACVVMGGIVLIVVIVELIIHRERICRPCRREPAPERLP